MARSPLWCGFNPGASRASRVTRRAFEQMDELLRRALELTQKTCCQDGCYACIAVSRCSSPFYASGERRPTSKAATRLYLQELLGVGAV